MTGVRSCFFSILCAALWGAPALEAATDVPGNWSVLPSWQGWDRPSAYQVGFEGWAELALSCGKDGRPVMGVLADGSDLPEGAFDRPAKIGPRHFLISWTGRNGVALARPDADLLDAMHDGTTLVLYDAEGAPVDFRLSGAADALDAVLGDCPPPRTERPGPAEMRRAFDDMLKARTDRECRALGRDGAKIGPDAVRERAVAGSDYPELEVDFAHVACRAGTRLEPDFCTATGCTLQRYLPGSASYMLEEDREAH